MGGLRRMLQSQAIAAHWNDDALLGAMLEFEGALARAQARCGLIPAQAAQAISQVARRDAAAELGDPAALAAAARRASTLAIPFVKALTERVAREDEEAARYVHWGATSQDVVDTATMLQARSSLAVLIEGLERCGNALAALANTHRDTVMLGRTLLQPAVPISFGWKAATWLAPVAHGHAALGRCLREQLALQLGGASGTLASLGGAAPAVAQAMAAELELPLACVSWHGARDRFARIGAELAIATGGLAKIGRDVALSMQHEVGELAEPAAPGRGGSSAMPHKRNPVGSMLALEAAYRAPALAATLIGELATEHERGLGSWQHSAFVLADCFQAAGSALEAIDEVLAGLEVNVQAMRANLDRTRGLVFAESVTLALATRVGKARAAQWVEEASRRAVESEIDLRAALEADARVTGQLDDAALDAAFDAGALLAGAHEMISCVLAAWRNQVATEE